MILLASVRASSSFLSDCALADRTAPLTIRTTRHSRRTMIKAAASKASSSTLVSGGERERDREGENV